MNVSGCLSRPFIPLAILMFSALLVGCIDSSHDDEGSSQAPVESVRKQLPLSAEWQFSFGADEAATGLEYDTSDFETIDLPHAWDPMAGEDGGSNYPRGAGYYRKTVNIPAADRGSRVFIEFEAGSTFTAVFVNGQAVGEHRGAFSAFRFDITDFLEFGSDNLIAVRADNSITDEVAPIGGDFTVFGGLHRNVHLIVADPVHIDLMAHGGPGVYLTPTVGADSASVEIRADIINDGDNPYTGQVTATVLDAEGNTVAQASQDIETLAGGERAEFLQTVDVANPRLWHGRQDPYLYQVAVEVHHNGSAIDSVVQPLGIRTVAVDPVAGFFLNGEPYDLNGVAMHHMRQGQGYVLNADQLRQDYDIMAEMGVTAVRMSHYPHSEAAYDIADEAGMVVWTEIPLVNGVGSNPAFDANAETQLLEMIHQNYNHPSVAFWGTFNEITLQSTEEEAATLLAHLSEVAKEQDATRPVTGATVLSGPTADPGSPTNATVDLTAFNTYFGWYYKEFEDLGIFLDENHAGFPNTPVAVSEYGAGASPNLHSDNPNRVDHSEEYQMLFHESYLRQITERDYLWGSFAWVMFDFASDARDEGESPGVNDKGLVTADRSVQKDVYYIYQANWTEEPMLYLTSKRFNPRRSESTDVKVYSNLPEVTLSVGNLVIGTQPVTNGMAVFENVELALGDNPVEVSAPNGAETLTDSVIWSRELNDDVSLQTTRLGIGGPYKRSNAGIDDPLGKISNLPYRTRFGDLPQLLVPATGTGLSLVDATGQPLPGVDENYIIQGHELLRVMSENQENTLDYEFVDGPLSLHKYVDVSADFPPERDRYAANDGHTFRDQYLMWFSFGEPGWWKVHLGDTYYIHSIEVVWPTDQMDDTGGGATQYLLEVSNTDLTPESYDTIVDASDNAIVGQTTDAMGVTASFMRLQVVDTTVNFVDTTTVAYGAIEISVIGGYIHSANLPIDYVARSVSGASGRTVAAVLGDIQSAGAATVRIEDGSGSVQAGGTAVTSTMVVVAESADGMLREAYTIEP